MVSFSIVKQNHHILYVEGHFLRRERVHIYIMVHFSSHINITSNLWILIGQSQVFSGPVFLYNDH